METGISTINKYRKAYRKIEQADNILLAIHERPDGDALASIGVMIELFEWLGKQYTAFCLHKPAFHFFFLPHVEKILYDKKLFNFPKFDLVITLDCGSLQRTGLPEEISSRHSNQFIIEFDHHPKADDYSELEIRMPQAASTSEILYYFLKANRVKITKNMANCILAGILTDTSNFLHQNTSENIINIASEMILRGAQFSQITKSTQYNTSLPVMKLWGTALANLKINKKYNFAFTALTREEIKESGGDEDIFDSMTNFLSNLHGVKGVMLLREEAEGKIKGSLRSTHPTVDISRLASLLGGGGHPKASGFLIDGRLEKFGDSWRIV